MKIVASKLSATLTDGLASDLHGLTKKHTRQLHKEVAHSVKKLARTFARLRAKEQRAHDKQQRRATKASVQCLVLKLHELLAQPPVAIARAQPAPAAGAIAA